MRPRRTRRPVELPLCSVVGAEHVGSMVAGGHAGLEFGEGPLHPLDRREALGDVLAEADLPAQRRALVVQGHDRALGERDLARVGRELARDEPQQGGLPVPVAPDNRQAVARIEAERQAIEQGSGAERLARSTTCTTG